ncbi:MAG TPA: hypothetical protein VFE51_18625 [Verrucomicrobiae bacterium]|nr:hypothetical protein [Verrucomicrobiae bacterium]
MRDAKTSKNLFIWTRSRRWQGASCCLLAICLLLVQGCRSTSEPGDHAIASVRISGNTPGQIRDAAVEVFTANGYKTVDPSPGHLVFEKPGGHMTNFTYGSWLGDDPLWIRIKAAVLPAGEMTYRFECSVFLVKDKGGSTEEQSPLGRVHRRSYQKMLDEIAARFQR